MSEQVNWASVLAGNIGALAPQSAVRVGGWVKDSAGEGTDYVHASNCAGRWIEARLFGTRYWMFTESGYESHMQFFDEVGTPEQRAVENAEEMDWAARVCVAYLEGDFTASTAKELLLPWLGKRWVPKLVSVDAITIYPSGGESAQFLHQSFSRPMLWTQRHQRSTFEE